MCGIAGIVSRRSLAGLDAIIKSMNGAMLHRGPDDGGSFMSPDGKAALGNRRLAIRDLSKAGHMPMCNAEGDHHITYNGEIYNANELRDELIRLGYSFRSQTDTEVILNGYQAWGADVIRRLRGMFAFAILVLNRSTSIVDRVFLARDRLGIKPLFYTQVDGAFLFASELKALRASGLVANALSPEGLKGYLALGSVPNPWTIYDGVWALPPATSLLWQDGHLSTECYWSFPTDSIKIDSYGEALEFVRCSLGDAVQSHLVSDVPLGAFLSGGLDSSSVVSLAKIANRSHLRTCSIAFLENDYNEAPYAKAVAEMVGSEHYERVITAREVIDELPTIFNAMDQPTMDAVNTYFVSKVAREAGLTVALSGLGGDEIFGGYPNTFRGVPRVLTALRFARNCPGLGAFAGKTGHWFRNGRRWTKLFDALTQPVSVAGAYLMRRGLFSTTDLRQLVTSDIWHSASKTFDPVAYIVNHSPESGSLKYFRWVAEAELRTYTTNQLLRDTDVMSMAHSLEVRVPLLDDRLVENIIRLPHWVQGDRKYGKKLLIDAIGADLPDLVLNRRDKMGFSFPFGHWLKGPLKHLLSDARSLNPCFLDGCLQSKNLANFLGPQPSNSNDWIGAWALIVLKFWAFNA